MLILPPFPNNSLLFQGRIAVSGGIPGQTDREIAEDEGHSLDTVDLNMSVVTQTWPSTCSSAKLAAVLPA